MKKIKDLLVKTGSYETQFDGTKNRYENIGAIMEKEDGGKFMFLKRSFNPAGVPFKEGSDSIIVSMFDVKEKEESSGASGVKDAFQGEDVSEEIPF